MERRLTSNVSGHGLLKARWDPKPQFMHVIAFAFINMNDFSVATGMLAAYKNIHECQPQASFIRFRPTSPAIQHRDVLHSDWFPSMHVDFRTRICFITAFCLSAVVYRFLLPFTFVIFYRAIENGIWELRFCSLKTHHRQSHLNGRLKKSKLETMLHVEQSLSAKWILWCGRFQRLHVDSLNLNSTFQEKKLRNYRSQRFFLA